MNTLGVFRLFVGALFTAFLMPSSLIE